MSSSVDIYIFVKTLENWLDLFSSVGMLSKCDSKFSALHFIQSQWSLHKIAWQDISQL